LNKIFFAVTVSLLLVGFGNYAFAQYDDKLVVLETNLGNITIDFFPNDAPNHVDNFIGLAESGFYDGVIFHRIIPGFMIQGGDPNTIHGDPSTWGTGGPSTSVDAEFNTIKHNRGIVSMARSADPNSGGSQFFIVHGDSSFLDEQYTVFGRIVTQESFETLDKITGVETEPVDRPVDPEQVKITKAIVVNRSEVSNILELPEPERTQSTEVIPSTGNQKYESTEHEIGFSVPEGWLLQNPDKTQEYSPDVAAIGPKTGVMNPQITLTVQETNQKTLDDLITEQTKSINQSVKSGNLKIISQEKTIIHDLSAYVTSAEELFSSDDETFTIKHKVIMIYDDEKLYTLTYTNGLDDFNSQLPRFEESVESFEILSKDTSVNESTEEGGGCLIATATFGTEFAPQVQQLREIRDNTILSTKSGIAFMSGFNQFYYSFSPVIADLERESPIFKEIVKISITPMLSTLSILNFVEINSEEEMISYGVGIVLMNIGMYFAAPAMIIYKIRK
jgi:peptidyl-prolyl cis-trans isomerase B (cyclophilin B)